ncbi:hypothetical protein F3Y22_tig00111303pilonHSYRG00105 [Hibiscus syriacus]|uniref:Uncharacterized protein n=1 Tax=Hibiscus syriacus TaxID=106335 RepID=A0A6A2YRA0_HIBSY|nr:hypothetical protein F3Y22_tig00111303pilonHSYRG00105 [Hibiscus syriacus]
MESKRRTWLAPLKASMSWWNFKDDLDDLKSIVSAINAVLLDAEERSVISNLVKEWLGKLKYALYDADDLLDDFSTEALRKHLMNRNELTKVVRVFFSSSNQFAYGLKMERKIKARFASIQSQTNGLKLVQRDHPAVAERRQQTHSFVFKDEIIGREDDKKALLKLLLDIEFQSEENVIIVPIVGIGGLGKTALAQFVFNHERVKDLFDLRILYPKDHRIKVQSLVQLWIAPDFVKKSNPCQSLEEVGLEYFKDLMERNFFQEAEGDEWGMTCTLISLGSDLKILPDSICEMQNLQVLKLDNCLRLEELPKIEKLVNLSHLACAGCRSLSHMSIGIGTLTSLQTLSLFVVDKLGSHGAAAAELSELGGLHNLRGELRIINLGFVKNAKEEFRAANLKEKHYLHSLVLHWGATTDDEEKSLEDLQPHPNLRAVPRFQAGFLCSQISLILKYEIVIN